MAYMWLMGFWKMMPGFSGRYWSSNPSVKVSGLKTALMLGVMVLSNCISTASGMKGVWVIVGVLETNGVLVIEGVRVIVGETVIDGVMVLVGVIVKVGVGG